MNKANKNQPYFPGWLFICIFPFLSSVPNGLFPGDPFAPAAGPGFHKTGSIGDLFRLPEPPEIRNIGPAHRNDPHEKHQRPQEKGLHRMAEFMHPDGLGIGMIILGGKDKQPQAQPAPVIPLGINAAPVHPMAAFFPQGQEKSKADQRLAQPPGALPFYFLL